MDRLTQLVDGELRIAGDPPLIEPIDRPRMAAIGTTSERIGWPRSGVQLPLNAADDRRQLLEQLPASVDVARKVVGVGSVGTRAWIALLLGRDGGDPLFLQCKRRSRRCSSRTPVRPTTTTTASGSCTASA